MNCEAELSSDRTHQAVRKYLTGYSEPEVTQLSNIHTHYDHTLIIPLYDESFERVERILRTDFSFRCSRNHQSVLFVLVVNCPESGDCAAEARTILLLEELEACLQLIFKNDNVAYGELLPERGVIVVDRCTQGQQLPKKQGVGLARKIGADIAAYLMANKTIRSRWIHSTDADVVLPERYFDCVNIDAVPPRETSESIALVYPFNHVAEAGYEVASELYDWSLRYYVESIRWAGSTYAYHTIGSLIAVDFEAYAKVRGFPKRSGGEDFYLLNKLAKVGRVSSLTAPVIDISARPSQRVPFGTGPAICKITENQHAVATHVFYHPAIFSQLKIVYATINQCWGAKEKLALRSSTDILEVLKIEGMSALLGDALDALGFPAACQHAVNQSRTELQFIKQMTVWFDAFKTLKFVHYLRDHGYSSITLKALLHNTNNLSEELVTRANRLLNAPK